MCSSLLIGPRVLEERAEHVVGPDERVDLDALVVPMSVLRVARPEVHRVYADEPELRDRRPGLLQGGEVASAARSRSTSGFGWARPGGAFPTTSTLDGSPISSWRRRSASSGEWVGA